MLPLYRGFLVLAATAVQRDSHGYSLKAQIVCSFVCPQRLAQGPAASMAKRALNIKEAMVGKEGQGFC